MEALSEELLTAWLRLTGAINNQRLVDGLSFNEAVVCGLLEREGRRGGFLTASELCAKTKILKSQMNAILRSLEPAGVGAETLFWKVKMKPGSCILAARRGEKVLISLSGNPGAAGGRLRCCRDGVRFHAGSLPLSEYSLLSVSVRRRQSQLRHLGNPGSEALRPRQGRAVHDPCI